MQDTDRKKATTADGYLLLGTLLSCVAVAFLWSFWWAVLVLGVAMVATGVVQSRAE